MEYEMLTKDNEIAILNANLGQLENEHYGNVVAQKRAEALGDETQIAQFQQALSNLEKQIEAIKPLRAKVTAELEAQQEQAQQGGDGSEG